MRWFQLLLATVVIVAIIHMNQQVEAKKLKKKELLALILLSKIPKKKLILPIPLPLPLPIPIFERTKKVIKKEPVVVKKIIKVPYEVPVKEPYYEEPYYDSYSAASGGDFEQNYHPSSRSRDGYRGPSNYGGGYDGNDGSYDNDYEPSY
uniref:Uncharacterized protein LOC113788922 n=1 Tax=Dermatophagoides pteronyssinus TaxID=6956 RepID=A0A6P6XQM8_DERPT|nr:uncharacterized protein LOC113788922 [Dermatophagoides pteronyssinus]